MTENTTLIQQKTELISAEGGTINLADRIDFTVPAGALTHPTEISVALHHRRDEIFLHFEPHGTVFKYPAQLTIPRACWEQSENNPTFTIYYQANGSHQWQPASFVTWAKKLEAFHIQIPHFSSYYFIRRQGHSVFRMDADKNEKQLTPAGKETADSSDEAPATPMHQADNCIVHENHRSQVHIVEWL